MKIHFALVCLAFYFLNSELMIAIDIAFTGSTEDPSILTVYLSSVPSEHLDTLDSQFKAALARIAGEGIDMVRMKTIIERQRLQLLESIETDAVEVLSQTILAGESNRFSEVCRRRES